LNADIRPSGALELAQRFVDEVWNRGHYGALAELMSEPYEVVTLNHGAPPLGNQTRQQMTQHVREFRDAIPDLRLEVVESLDAGDHACLFTRLTGTQRGPLMGLPPSNQPVVATLAAIYRAREGRLTGHTVLADMMGLMPGPPLGFGPAGH